jgi:hypothetical protein
MRNDSYLSKPFISGILLLEEATEVVNMKLKSISLEAGVSCTINFISGFNL